MKLRKLDKCPIDPACVYRTLYLNEETNEVLRYDARENDFLPHTCKVIGSEPPTRVYLGKWLNVSTGRIRWTGPTRLIRSAKRPPSDGPHARNKNRWELKGVFYADISELQKVTEES